MYKALTFALAATAAAMPMTTSDGVNGYPLYMEVEGSLEVIGLFSNGTPGNFVLGVSSTGGTPAVITAEDDCGYSALNFEVADKPNNMVYAFGVSVLDVGHKEDVAEPVFAIVDNEQYEWNVNATGGVTHMLESPLNQFFACKDSVVGGKENTFLKWGDAAHNGKFPKGCTSTSLQLAIPGGAPSQK